MQISLNIKDETYHKLMSAGVDMQSKIDDYLTNLIKKEDDYLSSKEFQENKAYFHEALREIEAGEITTLSHNEIWERIEEHTKSI